MRRLKQRRMGRTGLMVTELGLGAMDIPQVLEGQETLHLALDMGINFVDTAREYQGSEYLIGQVIRERETRGLHIATKTFSRSSDGAQYDVDRSLRVLDVERIDLYQLHDVSTMEAWAEVTAEGGALEGLKIAKVRGLVGHIGISSHRLEVLEKAITSGEFETVMLEYSVFYPVTEELIGLAHERDVGVIVMRPLGGSGRTSAIRTKIRTSDEPVYLTPTMLLRYVLSNPNISVAIPGARYPSRIRENVELALTFESLDASQKRRCEEEAELL